MTNDPWKPDELDLPAHDAAELAGLLAVGAGERKPPAGLKQRVLARLHPARPSIFARAAALTAAVAAAALLLALGLWSRRPTVILAGFHGSVLVDGRPAQAGQAVRPGQAVAAGEGAEAVLVFGPRAAVRLLRGAEVVFHDKSSIEIDLRKGWLLSAVAAGTPYGVVTEHGRIHALGTDFITKTRAQGAYVCICHGRLRLSGAFGQAEIASENHASWVFAGSQAPRQPDGGTMEGHSESDIVSLRSFLRQR